MRFNLPSLTRALLIALVVLTTLNAALKPSNTAWGPFTHVGNGVPYFSIVPGQSPKYPWTFATASFVEQNVFGLITTGLTITLGGRYLERAYGQAEFAKFGLFSTVLPNVISFCIYIAFYVLTKNTKALTATISGGISIQASFLCAFKQLVPEHSISISGGLIRLRVKHFPAIFLLANTVSGILLGTETAMFLAWLGFVISWVYLRFFRVATVLSAATGGENVPVVKGDASETFAFAEFFPEPIKTPVATICDLLWTIIISLGICRSFSQDDVELAIEQRQSRAANGLPVSRHERRPVEADNAERRRALALKALDERLSAASSTRATPRVDVVLSAEGVVSNGVDGAGNLT